MAEQERPISATPWWPNLNKIAWKEINARRKLLIPEFMGAHALSIQSPTARAMPSASTSFAPNGR
nr:hypothetical protein [Aeromonas caviae]